MSSVELSREEVRRRRGVDVEDVALARRALCWLAVTVAMVEGASAWTMTGGGKGRPGGVVDVETELLARCRGRAWRARV